MDLIKKLGGYEKAKLIVNSALDFTHIDIYEGFEYFIYEKQNSNGNINDVLTFNPRLNHSDRAIVQGGLDKYGAWHVGINEIKTTLLEYRRQHNIFEEGDPVVMRGTSHYDICEFVEASTVLPMYMLKDENGCKFGINKKCVDHATPEEIKAGHRL